MDSNLKQIDIIIQARLGSTRLPNKILKLIDGKPILWHVYNRLSKVKKISNIIVATTDNIIDKTIIEYCTENNILYYIGSENDVLDRYYQTAKLYKSDIIVRCTSDCPLIDPNIIDIAIEYYLNNQYDYICNTHFNNAYPSGYDCGIINMKSLTDYHEYEKDQSKREHAFGYLSYYPEKYKVNLYSDLTTDYIKNLNFNLSKVHLSVDTHNDYILLKYLIENNTQMATFYDIMNYIKNNIGILKINQGIEHFNDLIENNNKLNKKN
jgi:spore coat polysaccharide biosynthesis protein SpsF